MDKNSFLTFLLSQEGDVIKNILNNIEQIVRMDQVSIINFLKDKIVLNKAKELRLKLGDLVLIKANQVKMTTLRKRIKSSNQVNLIWNDIYLLMVLHEEEVIDYLNIDEKIKEQLFTIKKSTINNSIIKNSVVEFNGNRNNKRNLSPNKDDNKRIKDDETDSDDENDEDMDDDEDLSNKNLSSHESDDLSN
jgi:hypothetical protein